MCFLTYNQANHLCGFSISYIYYNLGMGEKSINMKKIHTKVIKSQTQMTIYVTLLIVVFLTQRLDSDKRLLFTETIIGTIITISFLLMIFLSIFAIENIVWKVITMVISFVIFIIGVGTCLLIEQKAGYYQCDICKYKYIPSYKQVLFAMHSGRTRYMRCPKCHKKSWNKKIID